MIRGRCNRRQCVHVQEVGIGKVKVGVRLILIVQANQSRPLAAHVADLERGFVAQFLMTLKFQFCT